MIDAARSAQEFASGRTRDDLASDKMLVFALVRAIEVVGEAASRISPETRLAIPVAMRNRLVHAYFDVDLDILWNTVTLEIPELLAVMSNYVGI